MRRLWLAALLLAWGAADGAAAFPLPWLVELPDRETECPTGEDAQPIREGQVARCELEGRGDRHVFLLSVGAGERWSIRAVQTHGFGVPCLELRPTRAGGDEVSMQCEANNPRLEPWSATGGPYRITVWDEGDDDVFGYRLLVRRLDPPAVEIPRLRAGSVRTSELEGLGDRHVFRLETMAGELLRLQLGSRSALAEPCLELWREGEPLVLPEAGPTGMVCGGADLRIERRFEHGGPLVLVVSDDNDDALLAYTLVVQRLDPLPDSLEPLDSWQRLEGRIGPVGGFELHALDGVSGEVFAIQAVTVGGVGSPCVELFRPDASLLAIDCAAGAARIVTTLDTGGRHALVISARGAERSVDHVLAVARIVPPAVSARPLPRGIFRQGQLAAGADLALYTFSGLVGAGIVLELVSEGGFGEPCFELYRPDGSLRTRACAARDEHSTSRRLVLDQAGSQVLLVHDQGFDESLPYRLSLAVSDEPSDTEPAPDPLDP